MSTYWSDLKIDGNSNLSIYVGLGCFAALFLAMGIHHVVKKKSREKILRLILTTLKTVNIINIVA